MFTETVRWGPFEAGQVLLAVALLGLVVGLLWIRRIVTVDEPKAGYRWESGRRKLSLPGVRTAMTLEERRRRLRRARIAVRIELGIGGLCVILPTLLTLSSPSYFGRMFWQGVSILGVDAGFLIASVGSLAMLAAYSFMWWLVLHDHEARPSPWLRDWR